MCIPQIFSDFAQLELAARCLRRTRCRSRLGNFSSDQLHRVGRKRQETSGWLFFRKIPDELKITANYAKILPLIEFEDFLCIFPLTSNISYEYNFNCSTE